MSESVNEKELQKERKEIIARILEIQKKFMDLESKKGVTVIVFDLYPQGIVKVFKEVHEKLANILVDIAHQIKGSIRT